MLLHLENHVNGTGDGEAIAHHSHRLIDRREVAFVKLHVNRRSRNLNYVSDVSAICFQLSQLAIGN